MTTNFLELATTLNFLGAKWLPEKKINFTACVIGHPHDYANYMYVANRHAEN